MCMVPTTHSGCQPLATMPTQGYRINEIVRIAEVLTVSVLFQGVLAFFFVSQQPPILFMQIC